jgi:hypothetical protein
MSVLVSVKQVDSFGLELKHIDPFQPLTPEDARTLILTLFTCALGIGKLPLLGSQQAGDHMKMMANPC